MDAFVDSIEQFQLTIEESKILLQISIQNKTMLKQC